MNRIAAIALALVAIAPLPVAAEPVENTTEIAKLLASLGDRCWAVDVDGTMIDAATLAEVVGPADLELECIVEDAKPSAKALPATVI